MESYNGGYNYSSESGNVVSGSIAKVFGLMFLGLLITSGISFGLYYALLKSAISPEAYLTLFYVSAASLFIVTIVSHFVLLRGNAKVGMAMYLLYTIMMGILLSTLFLAFELKVIGFTFLVTASVFGVMALYGLITKRNTASLGMFGIGLLWGVLIMSLVNWFIGSETLYWMISYIGLAAMLLITAWDVNRIKNVSQNGMMTQSLAIYLALEIYSDFIYIFIRLLSIFARSRK